MNYSLCEAERRVKTVKPILFNTEMIKAILEGKKTVTRRAIKIDLGLADMDREDNSYLKIPDEYGEYHDAKDLCKYQVGDVLYIRETWKRYEKRIGEGSNNHIKDFVAYKADENKADNPSEFYEGGWKPSIHMPKELARIFLKVTGVRVEKIQYITIDDIEKEGYPNKIDFSTMPIAMQGIMFEWWTDTWNSTIKKQDLEKYGMKANPWVWVIEFQKMEITSIL